MKWFIVIAILFGIYKYWWKDLNQSQVQDIENTTIVKKEPIVDYSTKSVTSFSCDGRQHCSQMNSREEAEFFVKNCPNTKMDGDNDGIPCENHSAW